MFTGRRTAFKFQQRCIEPLALADETLMVFLQCLQTRSRPFQFGLRFDARTDFRGIAPGALEFDFGAATGTCRSPCPAASPPELSSSSASA